MDYNWLFVYFAFNLFEFINVKDIFNLCLLNREVLEEYSKNIHWERKYKKLFTPNTISNTLGYKSTLKLLVYSSKLCCLCLEPLWKNPTEKNYLHVCDCNFSGLFLRSHHDCIKKYFVKNNSHDRVEYMFCPFCSKRKMSIPIQITS